MWNFALKTPESVKTEKNTSEMMQHNRIVRTENWSLLKFIEVLPNNYEKPLTTILSGAAMIKHNKLP